MWALSECDREKVVAARRPDGCAVPTSELAPVLRLFVDHWTTTHQDISAHVSPDGRRTGAGLSRRNELGQLAGNETVGAITILHERTVRMDPRKRGIPKRTIRNVLTARYQRTELRIADALLAAAHRIDAFHDGTVTVVPNPLASAADRASCCGGSMTGGMGGT